MRAFGVWNYLREKKCLTDILNTVNEQVIESKRFP